MPQHKLEMNMSMEISQEKQTVYKGDISPNVLLHQIPMNRGNMRICSRFIYSVGTTKHIRKLHLMIYYTCLWMLSFKEAGTLGFCLITVMMLRLCLQPATPRHLHYTQAHISTGVLVELIFNVWTFQMFIYPAYVSVTLVWSSSGTFSEGWWLSFSWSVTLFGLKFIFMFFNNACIQ